MHTVLLLRGTLPKEERFPSPRLTPPSVLTITASGTLALGERDYLVLMPSAVSGYGDDHKGRLCGCCLMVSHSPLGS